MEYLVWVVIALIAYSVVAPVASMATKEVPPTIGLFLSTLVFLAIATVVMVATGTADPAFAFEPNAMYIYIAGVFLTIGILAYIAALEIGPVSVVVPIYGMFIVGSSILGIVFLGEAVTVERVAGIGCAVLAIYFGAGEDE